MAVELVKPHLKYKDAYLDMVSDYRQAGERYYHQRSATFDFAAFLDELEANRLGQDLEPGYVPMSTFWLVLDDQTLVAESRLRHHLNPGLEIEGGHIGYAVRPSMRGQGYGTELLRLTLLEARKIGLTRVMLTCDQDNLASRRVMEKNGAVLTGETISPRSGKPIYQFWIELE